MSYKTIAQTDWKDNPLYHVLVYRKPETEEKENALDDFLFWLDHDSEEELGKNSRDDLQSLINNYVGYDIDKVKQGELLMLERWNKSVLG